MRLTLRWETATTLPNTIVIAARTAMMVTQSSRSGPSPWTSKPDRGDHRGRLRDDRHERGDRCGGAVVGVRRPEVERHRRELEAEANNDQQQAEQERGIDIFLALDHRLQVDRDLVEVGRSGCAVNPGHAVDQDRGREEAEQEVLERALEGGHAALGERGQDVGGERCELDADEEHHHVAGGRGDEGTEHGEGEQRVVLTRAASGLRGSRRSWRRRRRSGSRRQGSRARGRRSGHQPGRVRRRLPRSCRSAGSSSARPSA